MQINGQWVENITCRLCNHRHPASITCSEAKAIAQKDREDEAACETGLTKEQRLDDIAMERFTAAMKLRLLTSGRSGWRAIERKELELRVWDNMAIGEWLDVANYAMMLHTKEQS